MFNKEFQNGVIQSLEILGLTGAFEKLVKNNDAYASEVLMAATEHYNKRFETLQLALRTKPEVKENFVNLVLCEL